MARKSNEKVTDFMADRPSRRSVTIGNAEIRLIRTSSQKGRAYRTATSGQTVFVPGGSYKPERFPELEQLKRNFFDVQTFEA